MDSSFTLMELTPGTVALCLPRQGTEFYVLKEGMTPTEGAHLLMAVLAGNANIDALTKDDWRVVDICAIPFAGCEQIVLPPVEEWPKK